MSPVPARPNQAEATRLRVLRPAPGILAFYDGRVEGYRFAPRPNWIDEGGLSLGTASFALIEGEEALVYDTHTTPEHGRQIRSALEVEGARRFTVLLSHWHLDHLAGNTAFRDCEILATARTAELLREHREAIEAGEHEGPPGVCPLILPTSTFEERTELRVGERVLEVIHVDVHSDDAAVLWDPAARLLLAGDTVEDTVTYVEEPSHFDAHLRDLDRLLELGPEAVIPQVVLARALRGALGRLQHRDRVAQLALVGQGPRVDDAALGHQRRAR